MESVIKLKTKNQKNLWISTCCSEARDLSPHASQQGSPWVGDEIKFEAFSWMSYSMVHVHDEIQQSLMAKSTH